MYKSDIIQMYYDGMTLNQIETRNYYDVHAFDKSYKMNDSIDYVTKTICDFMKVKKVV